MADLPREGVEVIERPALRRTRAGGPAPDATDPFVATPGPRREVLGRNVAPADPRPVPVTPAPEIAGGQSAGVGVVAVLVFLVAAWGGIVPFVGPLFGFSADGSPGWTWNLQHALLWLAPGAAACVAALGSFIVAGRMTVGRGRVGAVGAGLLVALSGAWFAFGPLSWPVFERSAGVFVPAQPLRELSYWVGYSLGPGALLTLLGGVIVGSALYRRRATVASVAGAPRLAA
jgi:hypothetical protein